MSICNVITFVSFVKVIAFGTRKPGILHLPISNVTCSWKEIDCVGVDVVVMFVVLFLVLFVVVLFIVCSGSGGGGGGCYVYVSLINY